MKKSFGVFSSLFLKIGIVVILLLIVGYLNLRVDLTQEKAYSLSSVSKELTHSLEDLMVVKVLASEDLPSNMENLARYLQDLLSEYQQSSRGKFRYQMMRKLSRDELINLAHQNNIRTLRFQIYEKDQMIYKEAIFGLIFEYQGRTESLSLAPKSEAKLEYEITKRIQSLAQHALPKIGVYRDSTYYDFPARFFEQNLASNFATVSVDLSEPLQDIEALLFTGVARNLPEIELYHLDQYIMQGGKLVFLQDRVDTDGYKFYPLDINIMDLLENYGFVLSKDVVLDMICDQRQTGLGVMANYPMYPILRGGEHPITHNIENIVMFLANGVSFSGSAGLAFQPILQSSIYSGWMEYPGFEIHKNLFYDPSVHDFEAGSISTAAIIKGSFNSYFAGSELAQNDPNFIAHSPQQEMVLFGDKELVVDPDKEEYLNRSYVIFNALDFLLERMDMIQIRSRQLKSSSLNVARFMHKKQITWGDLPKIENTIKLSAKIVAIALPSLLLILFGMLKALRLKASMKYRYE